MRRWLGPLLLGLGVFLLVTAGMLRLFVADRLVVTPIDQYTQTVAVGPGTYFDAGALQEKSGDLVARRTVKADVPASNEDTTVWDVSVVLETGDGTFVRATLDRVALDRKTGESVNCCGEAVDSEAARHSGVSYKFPFGVEKRDYQLWDPNSRQAFPARFISEEDVQGLTTYKFLQQVPGQELRRQEVPATLVGETGTTFQAPVWYQNVRTVWVEPRTGVIVKGNEQNKTTLRNGQGEDKVTVVQFDLTFEEATQRSQADLAEDSMSSIQLITLWLPLLALVIGLILVAAGVLLMREAPRPAAATSDDDEPGPADNSP
jgi:Porin PorA